MHDRVKRGRKESATSQFPWCRDTTPLLVGALPVCPHSHIDVDDRNVDALDQATISYVKEEHLARVQRLSHEIGIPRFVGGDGGWRFDAYDASKDLARKPFFGLIVYISALSCRPPPSNVDDRVVVHVCVCANRCRRATFSLVCCQGIEKS